jgi:adenylate cyclase
VRDAFCPSCGQANTQIDSQMKAADHGERKLATVLFADIVGSTQLIADLDPELAMERLRPAVAAMGQAVQRYDGTIARTLGDGVMALFGIPFAQEAHALLACKAALAMQAALAGEEGLAIRVGIHSGEVVSGFEEELTRERAAHGPVIHMASRLEHMAEPGGIYISEDTFRLVRPYCDAQLLGQHEIRGFARPIGVFRLLGLRPAVASQQFRRAGLGTYRGREREMQILEEALNRAERGEGLAIGISASPGLGKSRLCFEFSEWCRGQLVTVLEARAPTYGYAGPLQAILEFLRSFFRISPQDDAETARARIAWRLNELNPELTSELPILSEFLGVAEE